MGNTITIEEFLRKLDLEQYLPSFQSNDLTIELVALLTPTELERLGVTSLGHQKLIILNAKEHTIEDDFTIINVSEPTGIKDKAGNAAVQSKGLVTDKNIGDTISLWNPTAAVNWSFLFTPIFGSYLQYLNWKIIGNHNQAHISLVFTILTVILSIILLVFSLPETSSAIAFLWLIFWYFVHAKKQIRHVKFHYNNIYKHRNWAKPLGTASIFVCIFIIIMGSLDSINSLLMLNQKFTHETPGKKITFEEFPECTTANALNHITQLANKPSKIHDISQYQEIYSNATKLIRVCAGQLTFSSGPEDIVIRYSLDSSQSNLLASMMPKNKYINEPNYGIEVFEITQNAIAVSRISEKLVEVGYLVKQAVQPEHLSWNWTIQNIKWDLNQKQLSKNKFEQTWGKFSKVGTIPLSINSQPIFFESTEEEWKRKPGFWGISLIGSEEFPEILAVNSLGFGDYQMMHNFEDALNMVGIHFKKIACNLERDAGGSNEVYEISRSGQTPLWINLQIGSGSAGRAASIHFHYNKNDLVQIGCKNESYLNQLDAVSNQLEYLTIPFVADSYNKFVYCLKIKDSRPLTANEKKSGLKGHTCTIPDDLRRSFNIRATEEHLLPE